MQYVWKDIVKVNGWISAEAYPISGKMTTDEIMRLMISCLLLQKSMMLVLMMCKHI